MVVGGYGWFLEVFVGGVLGGCRWLRMVAYFGISNFEDIHYFHYAHLLLNSNESCLTVQ